MKTCCGNIYQIARKTRGYTQEEAAELLHISTRSISDYEVGKTIPPDDIVCGMIELYKCKWLGYKHLQTSNLVGQKYLPEISVTDLPKSVLRLQKEVGDLRHIHDDMIDIACDGVVDHTEKERWRLVTKAIDEVVGAALSVLFTSIRKEKDTHVGA